MITTIRRLVICCGWPGASVIDSSTWVVGGSDSPVAVETNTARQPANQNRVRASGIPLTHAKDFLRTKTHINTHKTHIFYVLWVFFFLLDVWAYMR